MINTEIIRNLHTYYAQYVPKEVRLQSSVKSKNAVPGYEELKADLAIISEVRAFSDFDMYVCSVNEVYVSDKVRNSKKHVLFIEYGNIDITENSGGNRSSSQHISITVASYIAPDNMDMLEETLVMNYNLNILLQILDFMLQDSMSEDACPFLKQIEFPAEIYPVEAKTFYSHRGWAATFSITDDRLL